MAGSPVPPAGGPLKSAFVAALLTRVLGLPPLVPASRETAGRNPRASEFPTALAVRTFSGSAPLQAARYFPLRGRRSPPPLGLGLRSRRVIRDPADPAATTATFAPAVTGRTYARRVSVFPPPAAGHDVPDAQSVSFFCCSLDARRPERASAEPERLGRRLGGVAFRSRFGAGCRNPLRVRSAAARFLPEPAGRLGPLGRPRCLCVPSLSAILLRGISRSAERCAASRFPVGNREAPWVVRFGLLCHFSRYDPPTAAIAACRWTRRRICSLDARRPGRASGACTAPGPLGRPCGRSRLGPSVARGLRWTLRPVPAPERGRGGLWSLSEGTSDGTTRCSEPAQQWGLQLRRNCRFSRLL